MFAQEQSDEASVVEEEIVEETPEKPVAKAEKSDLKKAFNRAMEIIWPWPILSLESGYPEVFLLILDLKRFLFLLQMKPAPEPILLTVMQGQRKTILIDFLPASP